MWILWLDGQMFGGRKMITQIVAPQYSKTAESTPLTKTQMKNCQRIVTLLGDNAFTFDWEETAEGAEFWESVYERLSAIADGEPLR